MFARNLRVVIAAVALGGLPVLTSVWPRAWPSGAQLTATFVFTFLGVVLIEIERRAERAERAAGEFGRPPRTGRGWRRVHRMLAPLRPRRPDLPARARPVHDRAGRARGRSAATETAAGSGRHRGAKPELTDPIPGQASFRGRRSELDALLRQHAETRATVSRDGTGRPVLLLLHGKPGVGKSALAQELARRLGDEYPDGQRYVNLGNAGDALSPGEILKDCLDAIGWPADEVPADTSQRQKIFRALTAERRMLFLFDAARDHHQVLDVLPSGAGCAVIVTSRRDLGPGLNGRSMRLDVPDADDALAMLHAVAHLDEHEAPECAVEVVELVGRLPLALQSAGERVSQEGSELCNVAQFLRDEHSRLARLTRAGCAVEEVIASEYRQLNTVEQRAFCLLTLVHAPTFVPWVLGPMLRVPLREAENLVARLSAVQLVDPVSRDETSGLVRYRLHPLVRLFATAQLAREPELRGLAERARHRLYGAYRSMIAETLRVIDPQLRPSRPAAGTPWVLQNSALPALIAARPEPWVRVEYENLVRCLEDAHDGGEWGLCWRIAARLDGCIPVGATVESVERQFTRAVAAAQREGSRLGVVDVLLAQGACLTALERYESAQRALHQAIAAATALERDEPELAVGARRRQALAYLKLGEGYLQMRAPHQADEALRHADELFARAEPTPAEVSLLRLLESLNFDVDRPPPAAGAGGEELAERYPFWLWLERSEERRRRREWDSAARYLDQAGRCCDGDARRTANLLYRRARLHLEQWRHSDEAASPASPAVPASPASPAVPASPASPAVPASPASPAVPAGQRDPALARRAVRRAAEAVVAFRRMDNPVGEVRARCLLVRALVAADQVIDAEEQMYRAEEQLSQLDQGADGALRPLQARAKWAKGVLLCHLGKWAEARALLFEATGAFSDLGDGRSHRAVVMLLQEVARHLDEPPADDPVA